MAKDESLTSDDKFELLIQALMTQREAGITKEALADLLSGQATAMQKALKPENNDPPMHAALAYPEGDRDKPREKILTHEFFYNQFPWHKFPESQHWRELELAEQVRPGSYRVIRKDGTDMTVEVTGETDTRGQLTRVTVTFPVSRDEKALVPPATVVLYQCVHADAPRRRFVEAMTEWMQMTMGEESVAV